MAFNRRFLMRDGTARTHPPCRDPNILQCEGPVDPEVGVAVLENGAGRAVAALLHFTCHPMLWVSADWPGAWSNCVRQLLGGACVPYAAATLDLAEQQQRQDWYDYEIQVFQIGDLAIAAWPGEPFVEGQLELKRCSPFPFTFVAHFANDSAGYQPTLQAHRNGGYETRTANWSKLAPGTLEQVSRTTAHMLRKLYATR